MLQHASLYGVRQVAIRGIEGAKVERVWGIIDAGGQETTMQLRSDGELDAYFGFVKEADVGNPVLMVEMLTK